MATRTSATICKEMRKQMSHKMKGCQHWQTKTPTTADLRRIYQSECLIEEWPTIIINGKFHLHFVSSRLETTWKSVLRVHFVFLQRVLLFNESLQSHSCLTVLIACWQWIEWHNFVYVEVATQHNVELRGPEQDLKLRSFPDPAQLG
jgi:hypothetical protein